MSTLKYFKKVLHRYHIIKDDTYADVIFGAVFANRIDSDPTWLYLVGPPSSGKTVVLQAMQGHASIVPISKMTKNSLVSGWRDPRKKGKINKNEHSLLPTLDGKIMVVKDFTSLLTKRRDDLHEILGDLRDAYDGSVAHKFGTERLKIIESTFGVIAGVTEAIDHHRGVLADLGERFLTYRMPWVSRTEHHKRNVKAVKNRNKQQRNRELKEAAHALLDTDPKPPELCDSHITFISRMASYVAVARAYVQRDKSGEPLFPSPEYPQRLSIQLANFATGLAMARGKTRITNQEINLARQMALESLTKNRLRLLFALCALPGTSSIPEISEEYGLSERHTRTAVDDLRILGLLNAAEKLGPQGQVVKTYSLKEADTMRQILFGEWRKDGS